jgi:hypothetical protein
MLQKLEILSILCASFCFLTIESADASTHYDALGIPEDASQADVRTAYHRQSILCHPDKNPNDPEAQSKFIRLGEAYGILRDPDRRAAYDVLLKHNRRSKGEGSSSSSSKDENSFEFNGVRFSMEELAVLLRSWETERPDLVAAMRRFEEFLESMGSETVLNEALNKALPDVPGDKFWVRQVKRFTRCAAKCSTSHDLSMISRHSGLLLLPPNPLQWPGHGSSTSRHGGREGDGGGGEWGGRRRRRRAP